MKTAAANVESVSANGTRSTLTIMPFAEGQRQRVGVEVEGWEGERACRRGRGKNKSKRDR